MERAQKLITSAFYNLGIEVAHGAVKPSRVEEDEEEVEEPAPVVVPEKENKAGAARRVVVVRISHFVRQCLLHHLRANYFQFLIFFYSCDGSFLIQIVII